MEPASTIGAWAKMANAIKEWPLWLLISIALSLSIFLAVPEFREIASAPVRSPLLFATTVAWIFTTSRAMVLGIQVWRNWRASAEARVHFVITPIEHQCLWGVSRQPDGSDVTNISGHFMVKNRTTSPLHLMTAKLIRPRINGEELTGFLTMQAVNSRMHGTAYVSGHFIPPGDTLPVSATILIRGVPKQRSGLMNAEIEMADADTNKERVKLKIRCLNASK